MHIFLNRGKSPSISRTQVEELLASEEAIVREFAMTCDVWRLGDPELQRQHLEQIADRGESIRSRYYMKPMGWKDMKPPLGRGVSRSELREYFRSLESVSRAEN
jgi:hypothetical protein